jgi:signal transduction histidine kinase
LDLVTRPVARGRGRSKAISERGSAKPAISTRAKTTSGRKARDAESSKNGGASSPRHGETDSGAERERARIAELLQRAEDDLSIANRRLDDADAVRRHLLENVASGGDEARRRFASALHDDALQLLTAAELQIERIRNDARKTRYAVPLDQVKQTLKGVEESLRSLLYNVSPASVDAHIGLADAIRDRVLALKARTGIEPDLDLRVPDTAMTSATSIVLKNVSEALANVEKHANATRVSISVEALDGGINTAIADNGTGFVVVQSMYVPGHLGLVAMRERAQLAGGWCRYESEPGAGTTVMFWVPNA